MLIWECFLLQGPNTMVPLSSPSPGSRAQFPAPQVKVARVHTPQSPGSTGPFPHTNLPPPPLPPPHPTGRQESVPPTRQTMLTLPHGTPTAIVRAPEPFSAARLPFAAGSQPASPFSPQSPHEQFPVSSGTPTTPQAAAPQADHFQHTPSETPPSDPYGQPPLTPRPDFMGSGLQSQRSAVYLSAVRPSLDSRPVGSRPAAQVVYAPVRIQQQQDPYASAARPAPIDPYVQQITAPRPQDPYANQPPTPRPQPGDLYVQPPAVSRPRTEGEMFSQQQPPQQVPEVNRQLRDLLQRQQQQQQQQLKKLEQDQAVQSQARLWSQQGKLCWCCEVREAMNPKQ